MNKTASIGANIKRLRKERKLTQEELAEQLNLTTQAISKWESGAGLPDISQIVPLANAFGVSTDVLFGTVKANSAEIDCLIEKIEAVERRGEETHEGDYQEIIRKEFADYQEALKLYPNTPKLLLRSIATGSMAALHYGFGGEEEKASEIYAEIIREANLVVNYSRNINEIMQARRYLVSSYSSQKRFKEAEEEAKRFPWVRGCTLGNQLADIYDKKGDHASEIRQRCDNIAGILEDLYFQIMPLGAAYNSCEKREEAYRTYRAVYDLYTAIFGEEAVPFGGITNCYELTAIVCVETGRYEEAVEWLERIYELLKKNEPRYGTEFSPETPLLREHKIRWRGNKNAARADMLFHLGLSQFDPIRGLPRFKELEKKAEAMGK